MSAAWTQDHQSHGVGCELLLGGAAPNHRRAHSEMVTTSKTLFWIELKSLEGNWRDFNGVSHI